jgi:hypothetical protein
VRPKAWFYLSGGQSLLETHPNVYQELLEQTGDEQIIDEIKRDTHRQFPMHEMYEKFISIDNCNHMYLFL